jgi:hypothetical protein
MTWRPGVLKSLSHQLRFAVLTNSTILYVEPVDVDVTSL